MGTTLGREDGQPVEAGTTPFVAVLVEGHALGISDCLVNCPGSRREDPWLKN
jgi:hypothetical protein